MGKKVALLRIVLTFAFSISVVCRGANAEAMLVLGTCGVQWALACVVQFSQFRLHPCPSLPGRNMVAVLPSNYLPLK